MREIKLTVRGDTVNANRYRAGVKGEANATALVVSFDDGWDGYAKKLTFWDALEQNPVERTLTADLLVDAARDTRTYKTTIPGEPLALAGECLLIIDGWKEGVRARSMSVRLAVDDAPIAEDAGEPSDPNPTQAEQLQVQIDAIMADIGKAAAGAEAVEAAERAAGRAESYASHPPEIGENSNWYIWDGEKYVDTGVKVLEAEDGEEGGYYTPHVTQPSSDTMQVSFTPSKSGMESVAPVTVHLPAGPAGAAGKDGANGKDGADGYTPRRGVDYYTEADKDEMVNAVLDALPAAEGVAY